MKIGDYVEILICVADLQPLIYDDKFELGQPFVKKTCPQYGKVVGIDGGYIMVRPKYRRWEVECYDFELRLMARSEYSKVKNYRRT